MDGMNVLLLLEKLDPSFQLFMKDQRKYVIWAITKIQACMRGYQQRSEFRQRRAFATRIQKRWRGGETRRKLLGALDQFSWRKKQVGEQIFHFEPLEKKKIKKI
jgi:hypothetical protein